MKKIFLIGLILISLTFLTACAKCPKDYMVLGDSCCLDKNANEICDQDEITSVIMDNANERAAEYEKVVETCESFNGKCFDATTGCLSPYSTETSAYKCYDTMGKEKQGALCCLKI